MSEANMVYVPADASKPAEVIYRDDPLSYARSVLGGLDVATARNYHPEAVLAVGGRSIIDGEAFNFRATVLYGGSDLCGDCFVWMDDNSPVDVAGVERCWDSAR